MIRADNHFAKMSAGELAAFLHDSFTRHSQPADFMLAETVHAKNIKDRVTRAFMEDTTSRSISKEMWAAATLVCQAASDASALSQLDPALRDNTVFLDTLRDMRGTTVQVLPGHDLLTA